jgi:dTDP-4-amino-4,6-dideoxygalactose transaminase
MSFAFPEWPPQWPEIRGAVDRVVRSGDWGRYHSQICRSLQARIEATFGVPHARLCCSGTAAMEIALRVCQLDPGDQVVLAAYDFPGNFRTVELVGGRPVILDVSPQSLSLDPAQLQSLADGPDHGRVRVVIASHLYGRAAEIVQLREICDRAGWILIEDACQTPGMTISGRHAGSFGHLATLSFGGSKPVTAGGGGALLVNSERLAARLGGWIDRPGDTFPLSPLQAAVIEPQLDLLEAMNRLRSQTVRFIQDEVVPQLPSWSWQSGMQSEVSPAYYKVAWVAESSGHRDQILDRAKQRDVPMGAGYRSTSRCSERRRSMPFATPRADVFGERLFVLDHRALLLSPANYGDLQQLFQQLAE